MQDRILSVLQEVHSRTQSGSTRREILDEYHWGESGKSRESDALAASLDRTFRTTNGRVCCRRSHRRNKSARLRTPHAYLERAPGESRWLTVTRKRVVARRERPGSTQTVPWGNDGRPLGVAHPSPGMQPQTPRSTPQSGTQPNSRSASWKSTIGESSRLS